MGSIALMVNALMPASVSIVVMDLSVQMEIATLMQ